MRKPVKRLKFTEDKSFKYLIRIKISISITPCKNNDVDHKYCYISRLIDFTYVRFDNNIFWVIIIK